MILDSGLADSKSKVRLVAVLENKSEITLAVLSREKESVSVDLYFNVT